MKKFNIEVNDKKILQKGLESIVDFYSTLATDKKKFPEGYAFVTEIDSPFLNVFFDFRLDKKNSSDLVNSVTAFFRQYNIPWGWFIMPLSIDNDLDQQGFTLIEESPAMYFDLVNPLPNIKSNFITIKEIDNVNDMTDWIQPLNEAFQIKEDDDRYRKLNADLLQSGEKKLRHFVAYYKDILAAASTLFLSQDSVMLHNLGTKSVYKKCGLGTALTLYMMEQAQIMGFEHCFLDSSEEAFNLYRKIGFKVYTTTLIYSKT